MNIQEIQNIGTKVYQSIWTATQKPLRTFEELQGLMKVLATNKVILKTMADTLRIQIAREKENLSYVMGFDQQAYPRDIEICRDSAKRAVDSIESIEAWYLLAEKHRTLNTLEGNNWPRLQAVELLEKDIRPLCPFGYDKQFVPKIELKKDSDYIYWILSFLKSGTQSKELYQAIFGHDYAPIPDKLYLRLTDVLYKNENSGLSRTESQEFSDQGFTRDCISKFFEILFKQKDTESNPDLKLLYENFINDSYTNETIKGHIPVI